MDDNHHDLSSSIHQAVTAIHRAYTIFSYKPQHGQWTNLASFFLTRTKGRDVGKTNNPNLKIISLATGTKCTPTTRLSSRGESVHDSHAEVLARRCALRWMLEEIGRLQKISGFESAWMVRRSGDGRHALRPDVQLHLYVSTVPCTCTNAFFLLSPT